MADKFLEIINREIPTLVDFFAEWCGPCKTMKPVLEQLKGKLGDKLAILKIDVDANPKVAAAYQVQSMPTFLLFKSGKIVWRQSGAMPLNMLEQVVKQYAN